MFDQSFKNVPNDYALERQSGSRFSLGSIAAAALGGGFVIL